MKYCPNCGNQLKDNARFCGKCGNAVRELKQLETPVIEAVKRPVGKSAKKKSRLPIIAASIFALIVVGISGFIYFSKKNNTGPVQNISGKLPWVTEPSDVLAASAKYDKDGILIDSKVYKYSDDGLKAECARTEKNLNEGTTTRTTFYYELSKPYDISSATSYKKYDESGNVIQEAVFEDDGKKETIRSYKNDKYYETIFIYDEYGREILMRYSENGRISIERKNVWNPNGINISCTENGEQKGTKYDQYQKYDDDGNLIAICYVNWMEADRYGNSALMSINTRYTEYDTYKRKWKELYYFCGSLNTVELFTYRPADSLGMEMSVPEEREVKENRSDDFKLFKNELGDLPEQLKKMFYKKG